MLDDAPTILVVDDEPDLLDTITANVEAEGYGVLGAQSGAEALRALADQPAVGLALVDVRMPGTDGVEVLGRMKQMRPDLPVILMTAYAIAEREAEAVRQGAYTLVRKPFDMDAMLRLIARALGRPAVVVLSPDPSDRERILEAFESCAQRAIGAASAREANDILRAAPIDVAVLDFARFTDALAALGELHAAASSVSVVVIAAEPPREVHRADGVRIAAWVPKPAAPPVSGATQ